MRRNHSIAKLLIDVGANLNLKDRGGYTPLHRAVQVPYYCEGIFKMILEKGAEIDAQDAYGNTSLHLAIQQENPAIVRDLLDRGASMVVENYSFKTPYGDRYSKS